MPRMSSKTAAAIESAITHAQDLVRALEHASDVLDDSEADATQAVAWDNTAKSLRDLVRSAIARKTHAGTMWK